MDLPFAARRLFTGTGKEVYELSEFEKNEIVYVSSGENWNDPSLTQAEHQRRTLLANLAGDISKIRQYVALKLQKG